MSCSSMNWPRKLRTTCGSIGITIRLSRSIDCVGIAADRARRWRRKLLAVVAACVVVAHIEIAIDDQAVREDHEVRFVALRRTGQRHPRNHAAIDEERRGEDDRRNPHAGVRSVPRGVNRAAQPRGTAGRSHKQTRRGGRRAPFRRRVMRPTRTAAARARRRA